MRFGVAALLLAVGLVSAGCSGSPSKFPSTQSESLGLTRVVLYRNGVGYFERVGHVEGNVLRIRVRKDQVNDLLKSLTVVDRRGGRAVSISMPLDPQTWANAALATLAPGRGSLADVLDALRGTRVVLKTEDRTVSGRVVMVEPVTEPVEEREGEVRKDHRVTVLDDDKMQVVLLSKIKDVTLEDGDLAMQFHRTLDASAGEGMFQQVEVAVRLAEETSHDLLVSYVVEAPMWKPTYRVVLPPDGKGKALLQGWAVVDNTSGEDWSNVSMALTSGAPIAFRYDLHTPRDVQRADLTETGVRKQAAVAVGEASYGDQPAAEPAPEMAAAEDAYDKDEREEGVMGGAYGYGGVGSGATRQSARKTAAPKPAAPPPAPTVGAPGEQAPAVDFDSLRRSTLASSRAKTVSGLTRFDLTRNVTVPDGTSTMVAIINEEVEGEETFLFKPGGAGMGYEVNPYRVVRFKNSTPFVLEPGPISIYASGSFVGEGLSEAVSANTSATIPFAVASDIMVSQSVSYDSKDMQLVRIVRGVLEVERFTRTTTKWTVKSPTRTDNFTVLIRHPKAGWNYQLKTRPAGTEDLSDGYLVPVRVAAGTRQGEVEVIEQTPTRTSLTIWQDESIQLLQTLLTTNLPPESRGKIEPIVRVRQEIGRIDTQIDGLKRQRDDLDQRAEQTRRNLEALKKDPAAGALRKRLGERLEQFTRDGDRVGREVVELQTKRLEKKVELEDMLQNLDLRAPEASSAEGKK